MKLRVHLHDRKEIRPALQGLNMQQAAAQILHPVFRDEIHGVFRHKRLDQKPRLIDVLNRLYGHVCDKSAFSCVGLNKPFIL